MGRTLYVSLEREGQMVPVGSIVGDTPEEASFCYSETYLASETGAISISLPLQEEAFSPEQTKNYFEGLLPEGFTRRSVAQQMRVDENDYLSILHGLGRECLGAVCISGEEEMPEASYERITGEQVSALAAEGAVKSAELVMKSHLSLAGASGKVGLYYHKEDGNWYLPKGTAPSTHIVKQSHIRLSGIVANEQLSLRTAYYCGIEIPDSFIINTGAGKEDEVLFATQRYDRYFGDDPVIIQGLARPSRLHQEDFAQAMGIPATDKYEKEDAGYLADMFSILRKYASNPVEDQLKLWDMLVFDYLIGNTDAHIKNFSLLYGTDLRSVRLAPAYDIISTSIYSQSTREMSISVGGRRSLDEADREAFRDAAAEAGLGERMLMKRFDAMHARFREALDRAATELEEMGFQEAEKMKADILETGGIRTLEK